ncbi:TPA: hypothetical protein VJV92_000088 [Streptococcus pyogenes]|uniref:hypothetical protein n=1 Tax=Streptococcus pyogenes TaxID=1314 RepID=UPI0010E56BFA|nr:hypothetical protein [Streptococcus pyogenes]VGS65615.1 hypothetical membrane associated protein [Streptococcus pyogenes]VGT11981.1 hypothetical membrane associated protein [Streptococcus pyogenes]VGU52298.1 hypothetical membrane associated protein [Streptococcus pyogenes]VHI65151.1 hypothetical membrane associated protein [Streptococcus pyogenes]VHK15468.1 hypothetical membrane associated protein [Streptococcus pyogenes]
MKQDQNAFKTLSKRFQNLAALCLALLGTTLLMEQPVKAAERSDSHSEEQVTERRQSKTYGEGYTESYRKGYDEGYNEGFKKDIPQYPENNKNVINNKNYTPDSIRGPYDAYSDGFDSGYAAGWHKANDGGNSHHEESQDREKAQDKNKGESTGDSHHPESQDRDEAQDVEESTEKSHDEESQDNHETSSEGKNSTVDSTVFGLLSEIVETFVAFLWTLFG